MNANDFKNSVKFAANVQPGGRLRSRHWKMLAAGVLTGLTIELQFASGGPLRDSGIPSSAPAATQAAAQAAAASAAAAARQAQALQGAARALQNAQAAQTLARGQFGLRSPDNLGADPRNPGKMLPNVTNGLGVGGLDNSSAKADPTNLWQGANLPTQFDDPAGKTVNINQTAQKAILNWDTFNVGSSTTVNFLQGGSDWIALNRVIGNSTSPTQILGRINAPGSVYVINQNGIIFGGGSQINVHSLIASSLDVGDPTQDQSARNKFFLNNGIASQVKDATGTFLLNSFSSTLTDPSKVDGDVTVQPGASINTSLAGVSLDQPGFVYLFGSNVSNAGSITTPYGSEVALVAARGVAITPNTYGPAANSASIRGAGFTIVPSDASQSYIAGTGQVSNSGVISAPGGITILNGDRVSMSGVISADTGILRNSQIFLDAATSVDVTGTISILPLQNDDTPLPTGSGSSSSVTAFTPPSIEMSGFQINFGPTALISAPGANVALNGSTNSLAGRARIDANKALLTDPTTEKIILQPGATIDVSGLRNVELPADYNIVSFKTTGNEFADSPLQRNGALLGQTLYVDSRITGTRADGSTWIGTPLADASGFVSLVGRSILQLLTPGGSVSMNTELAQNGQVIAQGASINVAGGSVKYLPGYVPTTLLIGRDGHIYDISKADPNLVYIGIAGQFTVDHPRWNTSETYGTTRSFQPGYTEGRDAGGISVRAVDPQIFEADLQFGADIGVRQAALGAARSVDNNGRSSQGSTNELPSQGYLALTTPQSVAISDDVVDYDDATFSPTKPAGALRLSATQLSDYGLSDLSITANDLYLPTGSLVRLAPGGRFNAATSGAIDVEGSIVARGGQINLVTKAYDLHKNNDTALLQASITATGQSDITIGGMLDTRGLWINDTGLSSALAVGPGYINGGSISILTMDSDQSVQGGATGNIFLTASSVLDASSGGYINQKGVAKTARFGVLDGNGGNITLATFQGGGFKTQSTDNLPDPVDLNHPAVVKLDGTLRAFGFSNGGTLTLGMPSFQIGGTPSVDPGTLNLANSFFSQGGFGAFVLQSPGAPTGPFARSIVLAQNENVVLQQSNYSSVASYGSVATGSDIAQSAVVTTLPADLRKPVNLTLSSADVLLDTGSLIVTDAKAVINIKVPQQTGGVKLLGSIVDHGGALKIVAPNVWLGAQASIDLSGTFVASSTFGLVGAATQNGVLLQGGSILFDTMVDSTFTDTTNGSNGVKGSVIAELGASINISGAAADITGMVASSGLYGLATDSIHSWSDAGSVSINTGTFLWQGSFLAEAGASQGNRGSLALGGNNMVLQQTTASGIDVAGQIAAFRTNPTSVAPGLVATVDRLSAFDSVYLYAGAYAINTIVDAKTTISSTQSDRFLFAAPPLPAGTTLSETGNVILRADLKFNGDVDLAIRNRLYIAAGSIVDQTQTGADVNLSANYVMLAGKPLLPQGLLGTAPALPTSGAGNLIIGANTIDVQSATFNGFNRVTLNSAGDIRLTAPPINNGEISSTVPTGYTATFFGQIVTGGDLTLVAQRTYPVSAVDFEIVSASPTGTVRFEAPPSDTSLPLSAGGSLTVSAQTIIQNGNLFAPLGKIQLGAKTTADLSANDFRHPAAGAAATSLGATATATVTLGAGSLTSVTLDGQLVPYGETEDGTNWFYNTNLVTLGGPPTKALKLLAGDVIIGKDAVVDMRGGGDLLAFEFVQGKGGKTDVLSNLVSTGPDTRPTYKTPAIYAIIPSEPQQPAVGAFDIHFASNLGDSQPLAGQQVYLAGGNGLAAGWYTLYPAHYATMPGAYRVVDYGSAFANPQKAGSTLPDGTQIMAGAFGQSSLGLSASSGELFSVQSSSVWRQYSEIAPNLASSYFQTSAGHVAARPVLPDDGGRLLIAADGRLDLSGTFKTAPAAGGFGGQLDISAAKIDVVEHDAAPLAGYVKVDVSQIDAAGFDSVLIGGFRSDEAAGTLITAIATDVRVDLDKTALTAPELLLVAGPATQTVNVVVSVNNVVAKKVPVDGTGTVTIGSGSVVTATGVAGPGHNYFLGSATSLASFLGGTVDITASTPTITGVPLTAASSAVLGNYASVNGLGALLMVSNANSSVTRRNVPTGDVTVKFTDNTSVVLSQPMNSGVVKIEAGAHVGSNPVSGAQSQSTVTSATAASNAIRIDPKASLGGKSLTLAARSFAIGDNIAASAGAVISSQVASQITGVNSLTLQALTGGIGFYSFQDQGTCTSACPINFGGGTALRNLTLDTSSLLSFGADVNLAATDSVTLKNSGAGAPTTANVTAAKLSIASNEIDLGGGQMNISGFSSVNWSASERVFVNGTGSLTVGATDPTTNAALGVVVTVNTPNLLVGAASSGGAGGGSQFVLTTLGKFNLIGTGNAALSSPEIGGNLQINAFEIALDHATIQAISGTIALHATGAGGNIILGDSTNILAPGYAVAMGDQTKYSPGGKIVLTSDFGDFVTSASSAIDLSQPIGGIGWGGELDITALNGNLVSRSGIGLIDSTILANGGDARGGIFHLNIKGGLVGNSLDRLASQLNAGGFTTEVDIHTRTGGLVLDNTLTAKSIILTADEIDPILGRIVINTNGVLDASGASAGSVEIYARSVDMLGAINAYATDADQAGGSVVIRTTGTATGVDSTYGYETVVSANAGMLTLGTGASFDLHGGANANGGSLTLKLPLLSDSVLPNINFGIDQRKIVGVKDFTAELYATWSTTDQILTDSKGALLGKNFDGHVDPGGAYVDSDANKVAAIKAAHVTFYQTTLVNYVQNALTGFADVANSIVNVNTLPAGTAFHVRPGINLQNPDVNVNGGDITVDSAWNLAAGTMSTSATSSAKPGTFDPNTNFIQFMYRFAGVEPGDLTLRAIRNIDVKASISDGFFAYQNLVNFSPSTSTPWALVGNGPTPTDSTANTISPASQAVPLASYDLFPNSLNLKSTKTVNGVSTTITYANVRADSWSYTLTAGADFGSANPNAVGSLSAYGDTASGNLAGTGNVTLSGTTIYQVKPAFGSQIGPITLPTMLRTGVGDIAINAARNLVLADHTAPGVIYSAGRNSALLPSAGISQIGTNSYLVANPDGFVEPNMKSLLGVTTGLAGVLNGELGKLAGPLTAAAFPEDGGNIVIKAQQDVIGWQNVTTTSGGVTTTQYQFYAPWMFAEANGTSGAGAFVSALASAYYSPQTAWWIEFGRFDQGVLSAGGNVTVVAGRDVKDFSVSLPTTGRVSGGLSVTSMPVTHLYGSGNMTVRVGRELDSGSFYEGAGTATITVGGSVRSDWTALATSSKIPVPAATVLAVDTGTLDLTAAGSIAIGNIVNPAEIHQLSPDNNGNVKAATWMSTYGPNSAVRLTSLGGNVVIDSVPALLSNDTSPGNAFVGQVYPAVLEVTALSGNITTPSIGFVMTDSPSAALNLLAMGSVDLRGGITPDTVSIVKSGAGGTNFGPIGAGTALIDRAFNPFEPNHLAAADTTASSSVILAHANDAGNDLYDHIYAVTGDILGAGLIEIPRSVVVKAGRDIIDFNLTAQNLRATDVSQVIAGRDIRYDGILPNGGLQIAGPGFFDVEAGRNLGPFLPASGDLSSKVVGQQGIVSSGNAASFVINRTRVNSPVGNNLYDKKIGLTNPLLVGAVGSANGQRNFLLPATGASIVAMFGVAPGIDYQAVVSRYIDPTSWPLLASLPDALRHMLVDQVFFDALKRPDLSISAKYEMVNTMFPASLGYTKNGTTLGSYGSPRDQLVLTGNLDVLHATIQTGQGGDIRLFGPGGSILVGSLGVEPNVNLKLNNIGIITLDGGDVQTFTDRSVLVNSSRVFTEQNGAILMWSSNGDLDAGRGARTTASLNALSIFIDNNDYQTIDRGGLVTGAGIGTLPPKKGGKPSSVTLLTPTGTIDAGDAGIRATGDVTLVATTVLNAGNITASGAISGAPGITPPALPSAPPNTTPTPRSAGPETTGSTTQAQPSVVIVNVVGYGGGDGGDVTGTATGGGNSSGEAAPAASAPAVTDKCDGDACAPPAR